VLESVQPSEVMVMNSSAVIFEHIECGGVFVVVVGFFLDELERVLLLQQRFSRTAVGRRFECTQKALK